MAADDEESSSYTERPLATVKALVCLHSELPGTRRAYLLALARKWFDRAYGEFTDALEKIFAEHSPPLRLVARASNGEAFYEKA